MADEYTPKTEYVERAYVGSRTHGMPVLSRNTEEERAIARADFQRWLREHDARVLEDAADDIYKAGGFGPIVSSSTARDLRARAAAIRGAS